MTQYQSLSMRFIAAVLGALAFLHVASAQTCVPAPKGKIMSCRVCTDDLGRVWCYTSDNGGCCSSVVVGSLYDSCPSSTYVAYTIDCIYVTQIKRADPNAYTSLIYIACVALAWIINLCAVTRYCRARNVPAGRYICIAIWCGVLVWFCLIPAGRNATQILVVDIVQQSAGAGYGAEMQPYSQAAPNPYGQPAPNPC